MKPFPKAEVQISLEKVWFLSTVWQRNWLFFPRPELVHGHCLSKEKLSGCKQAKSHGQGWKGSRGAIVSVKTRSMCYLLWERHRKQTSGKQVSEPGWYSSQGWWAVSRWESLYWCRQESGVCGICIGKAQGKVTSSSGPGCEVTEGVPSGFRAGAVHNLMFPLTCPTD